MVSRGFPQSLFHRGLSSFLHFNNLHSVHERFDSQSHRKFQKAMRQFVDDIIYPDAQAREEDGKRVSQEVIDKMTFVLLF